MYKYIQNSTQKEMDKNTMNKSLNNNSQKILLKQITTLLMVASLSLLTACGSMGDTEEPNNADVEDRTGNGNNSENYEGQTGAYDGSGMADGSSVATGVSGDLNDPNSPLSIRTIYFEHDSTQINTQGQSALNAHAEYLSLNPNQHIVLEGHTDESGTRDYNLSLGERRGQAVEEFLSASGVTSQQMEVRSFGEENPVSIDQSESSRQLNRRVELLY